MWYIFGFGGFVETAAKLRGERLGEAGKQPRPISRPAFSALLEFDNMSTHLPTGLHLHLIDCANSLLPRRLNQAAQFTQQIPESGLAIGKRALVRHGGVPRRDGYEATRPEPPDPPAPAMSNQVSAAPDRSAMRLARVRKSV